MNKMQIEISTEYIQLVQLLKLANLINSGGEIKYLLAEEMILYNNEVEYRVRKKIYPGDIVTFLPEEINIEVKIANKKD